MEFSKSDVITIKGQFWSAGDNVYIDHKDAEGKWVCLCLNDFMKENIPQSRIVEIELTVKNPERR